MKTSWTGAMCKKRHSTDLEKTPTLTPEFWSAVDASPGTTVTFEEMRVVLGTGN